MAIDVLFVYSLVCLSVYRLTSVHKTRFSQKLNSLQPRSLLTTNRKSYVDFYIQLYSPESILERLR